ncbi:hypothetical protein BDY21DRAFT_333237 [Lineolata rhizophorae]|uniref:Uncharacterized protein n=1 Tax=Lineolata rhizophorae TaxID=578093 RepID=A0A6A6PAC0_9PEZI|nr:hypothetical protein BDY21DRAFT_333237 [Lineolata rhizophorae]
MYWPIGAPRVYAATQLASETGRNVATDDNASEALRGEGSRQHALNGHGGDAEHDSGLGVEGQLVDAGEQKESAGMEQSPEEWNADERAEEDIYGEIIGVRLARNGHIFATITRTTLTIWQTKPTVVVAAVMRSTQSLQAYGRNVSLLLRPDSAIFVVQTSLGYLITYSMATDPNSRVYKPQHPASTSGHARRHSMSGHRLQGHAELTGGPGEGGGAREVSLRFRMVIRVDAGITRALALDDELIVATQKPAAMQCIRWAPDTDGSQTSTELLSRMAWLDKRAAIVDMVHDRPMNLSTWVMSDGKAYAVQRLPPAAQTKSEDGKPSRKLFRGYGFHTPERQEDNAVKAAINARFSLVAVGCESGEVFVYTARDYAGHIPLSHRLHPNVVTTSAGKLMFLSYSSDGYCLFVGYEKGWITWSVYGMLGGNSFASDRGLSTANDEGWLQGVRDGFWIGGGSQIVLLGNRDSRLWMLDMARSAVAGCFSSANIARSLLQTNTGFMVYRGYDQPDLTAISAEISQWTQVQIPSSYLVSQWPIRCAVISPDGRYVAVAGRRGLAHYSVNSGRWKTFDDPLVENEFTVRGGMCWHQHVLIAAVESGSSYELRLYSREAALDNGHMMHVEYLPSPIVLISASGEDSLLVYTYENILCHYMINAVDGAVKLAQVGQITLHGIIRAPPRVRAISWLLPDDQLHHGDPSQDVAVASILFLVDGKLVLLQPATTEQGELKYEMRIIAQNVEYYALMRDQPSVGARVVDESPPPSPSGNIVSNGYSTHDLRDSLWLFDGADFRVWTDVQDVLASAPAELARELPATVKIPTDFYPLSPLLDKGILFGIEPELAQRRDLSFAQFRFATRVSGI